ncbi:MAG TPA: hypothetical protein VF316_19530 [Polyangiaceae bacterium]
MRRIACLAALAAFSVACVSGVIIPYEPPDASDDGGAPKDGSVGDTAPPKDGAADANPCGAKAMCNGTCVDTATDPQNCGACAKVCDVGDAGAPPDGGMIAPACAASTCGLSCGGILSLCSGNCVDTSSDSRNCGACGNACDGGSCLNKTCVVATVKVGNVADLGATGTPSPNYLLGSSVQVTKTSKLLSFGVLSKGSAAQIIMALYTDNAGSPGNLVAYSAAAAQNGTSQEFAANTQATLPVGTYWLMAEYNTTGAIGYTTSAPSVTTKYITHTFGSALPASFPAPSSYTGQQFNYWIVVSQ